MRTGANCAIIKSEKEKENKERKVKTMAREEIINRIETLEDKMFYLKMKDHWTSRDFELDRMMNNEVKKLKRELENK